MSACSLVCSFELISRTVSIGNAKKDPKAINDEVNVCYLDVFLINNVYFCPQKKIIKNECN